MVPTVGRIRPARGVAIKPSHESREDRGESSRTFGNGTLYNEQQLELASAAVTRRRLSRPHCPATAGHLKSGGARTQTQRPFPSSVQVHTPTAKSRGCRARAVHADQSAAPSWAVFRVRAVAHADAATIKQS